MVPLSIAEKGAGINLSRPSSVEPFLSSTRNARVFNICTFFLFRVLKKRLPQEATGRFLRFREIGSRYPSTDGHLIPYGFQALLSYAFHLRQFFNAVKSSVLLPVFNNAGG